MNISHNFFIYFKDNEPLLFNFKEKKEYKVRKEYLKIILDHSDSPKKNTAKNKIIQDLINTDVLITVNNKDKPYLNYYAHIFHHIAKDTSNAMSEITEEEWASQYLEICKTVKQVKFPERNKIEDFDIVYKLPKPENIEVGLLDTLKKRKTIREFEEYKTDINKLSNLLYYTFGYIHGEEEEYKPFKRRSSPSGGCLQIIEPYIPIFNVSGIENGIYWYEPETHSLCKVNNRFNYQETLSHKVCKLILGFL